MGFARTCLATDFKNTAFWNNKKMIKKLVIKSRTRSGILKRNNIRKKTIGNDA
jgi:hypothetical protein